LQNPPQYPHIDAYQQGVREGGCCCPLQRVLTPNSIDNITTKFSPLGASQNYGHRRVFRGILIVNKNPYHVYLMLGKVWCVYGGGGGRHVYHIRSSRSSCALYP